MSESERIEHDGLTYELTGAYATLLGPTGGAASGSGEGTPAFYPGKALTIPASVAGIPVVRIGQGAFANHQALETVVGPSTIVALDDGAFAGCSSLLQVKLPGVSSIGNETFAGCAALESVDSESGVGSIGAAAFCDCRALRFIGTSASLGVIGPAAFLGCASLGGLLAETFRGCKAYGVEERDCGAKILYRRVSETTASIVGAWDFGAEELTIPERVDGGALTTTEIASGAFQFNAPRRVSLPSTLTSIGEGAFAGSAGLEQVDFNDAPVEVIGAMAFCRCPRLDSPLPSSVRQIGARAFEGCSSLWRFEGGLPKALRELGFCAFAGAGIAAVRIPSEVSYVAPGAFAGCRDLEIVVFDGPTGTIASAAFADCPALEEVRLHDGLAAIYHAAFCHCPNLASIEFPDSLQTVGSRAFANSPKLSRPESLRESLLVADDAYARDDAVEYEVHVAKGFSLVKRVGR